MNVSLQNLDKVSALLTVKLGREDYQVRVEKSLKDFRKKANMPGFRPGMVPMGLIKRQYGTAITAEEVNKILQEKIYEYLRENKVNMLGEPLPDEERQQPIDFSKNEEFEFVFDIALAPEFEVALSKDDVLDCYTIDVSNDLIERQVNMYTQRGGKYESVQAYTEGDMLKGAIAELDEHDSVKEGGIQVEHAVMMPSYMKNDEQKAIFASAKVNEVLVFNPYTAFNGSEAELASLLKINKEDVANVKSNFSFQVEEITHFVPGNLDQELFDSVFGKDVVRNEEEFRVKIKSELEKQFVNDSDYKFLVDLRNYITEKVGKLEFPDALLKRIMLLNNKEKGEAFVSENYDRSIQELTWHLIKEKLVDSNNIKVENVDITNMAKEVTRIQFAQYGMPNVPEDVLDNYAKEMLKKKESVDSLVNRCIESKLAKAVKEQVTLNNKTVSVEDFNKMFE